MANVKPLKIGSVFARVTVLAQVANRTPGLEYRCRCSCGTVFTTKGSQLRTKNTRSCGCLRREAEHKSGVAFHKRRKRTVAGYGKRAEHKAFYDMHVRCNDVTNELYGGRGIKVCARWSGDAGFANFYSDMGPKPKAGWHLDRRNNNGNYTPSNCRWVSPSANSNNRRNTTMVRFQGKLQSLAALARKRKLPPDRVYARVRRLGWSVEAALEINE